MGCSREEEEAERNMEEEYGRGEREQKGGRREEKRKDKRPKAGGEVVERCWQWGEKKEESVNWGGGQVLKWVSWYFMKHVLFEKSAS